MLASFSNSQYGVRRQSCAGRNPLRELHDRFLSEFILTEVGAGMTSAFASRIMNYRDSRFGHILPIVLI